MRTARWVAVLLLCTAAAGAQEPPPEPPDAIEPSQIAVEADRVGRTIRAFDELVSAGAVVSTIEQTLPEVERAIDHQEAQEAEWTIDTATLGTLDAAEASWEAVRLDLPDWLGSLTARLADLKVALGEVDALAERWRSTEQELTANDAPEALAEAVAAVREQLADARERLVSRRGQLLTLQTKVAEQEARVERALEDLAASRARLVGRIFERDRLPLWDPAVLAPMTDDLGSQVDAAWRDSRSHTDGFFEENEGAILGHVALLLVLIAALRQARDRVRERTEEERGLSRVADVFEAPYSVALLLAITASFWIYPYLPPVLEQLVFAVALVPTIVLLRRFTPQALRPLLNALVGFYLLDRLRDLSAPLPSLARGIFVFELLCALGLISFLLRPSRLASLPASAAPGPLALAGTASRLAFLLLAASLAAEILGFSRLGQLVGGGVLESAYIGVLAYAGVRIFDSLVTFALRVRPLGALGMVKRSRYAMRTRIHRIAVVAASVFWAFQTLDLFAIQQPLFDVVLGVLNASVDVGSLDFSLADVLAFGVTIWLSFVISKFIRFALQEDVYPRLRLARGVPYAASTFVHYGVLGLGFFLAVAATGMDLNRFALIAGAFGVGIGFGLQNIVDNFVSGLILLTERPVKVGDTIETTDGLLGEVMRIGIRSSTVRVWTGAELIVPNSQLISERVTNWTLSDKLRRISVTVGVAYGTDVDAVLEILRGVASGNEDVLEEPAPRALFMGFGDSSLDFELRGWTGKFDDFIRVQSDLNVAINHGLAEAGMEIPFPQRDLHVRSVDPEAGRQLSGAPGDGA